MPMRGARPKALLQEKMKSVAGGLPLPPGLEIVLNDACLTAETLSWTPVEKDIDGFVGRDAEGVNGRRWRPA